MTVLVEVNSSNVFAVGYDHDLKVLIVQFKDGSVYEYEAVEEAVHDQMMAADSKGGFLHREIKGKYTYRKVE